MLHDLSRPQNNLNLIPTLKIAYSQKKITFKLDKIKSKNWRRHRKHMLFYYMSRPKNILSHNLNPLKAQFLPYSTLTYLNLNSNSTNFRLNLIPTSLQHQLQINLSLNINLNSSSTLTSTQYGSDIKGTQSCLTKFLLQTLNYMFE